MGIKSKGGGVPAGSMMDYAGGTVPAGWLLAYGQAVSRTTYAALFFALGVTHGAGDGATTFNLPDTRGRVLAGKDDMGGSAANRLTSGGSGVNGASLGAVGGGETHTLTMAQTPANNTPVRAFSTTGSTDGTRLSRANDGGSTSTNAIGGSGDSHRNVQPVLVTNKIIKI